MKQINDFIGQAVANSMNFLFLIRLKYSIVKSQRGEWGHLKYLNNFTDCVIEFMYLCVFINIVTICFVSLTPVRVAGATPEE